MAGVVGLAPLVKRPVESGPSPLLLYKSNLMATLLGILWYPSPLDTFPTSVGPTPWMVKVKPSALGLVSWKLKLVLNCWMFTGVVAKALRASLWLPSVNWSELPTRVAPPFRVIGEPLKKAGCAPAR